VGELLVVGGLVDRLLYERLDGQVVEVDLALLYEAGAGDLGDLESESQLVGLEGNFGVEADEFVADDLVLPF
jgi:hypothetical protein